MEHWGFFLNVLVVCLLFAQLLAIRTRYAGTASRLLSSYSLVLLAMGLVMFMAAVSTYTELNVFSPWFRTQGIGTTTLRTFSDWQFIPAGGLKMLFMGQLMLNLVFSPVLIAMSIPWLLLALMDYEGIPLSRRQVFMARLTVILNLAFQALLVVVYILVLIQLGRGRYHPDSLIARVAGYTTIPMIVLIYGSLALWSFHALHTRVFQSNPTLTRASRAVLWLTAVFMVLIIFQQLSRGFNWEFTGFVAFLAAQGVYTNLEAQWFLTGVWGLAGILVLLKTSPYGKQLPVTAPHSGDPVPLKDPETAPLPDTQSLRQLFRDKGLSERESEAAALAVTGASNKEIARVMDISYNTVKNHVASIFRKLDAGNRFELIRNIRSIVASQH